MDREELEQGQIIEALTLERNLVDAKCPLFSNFGKYPEWWNWWGQPWSIPAHQNPKGYMDVEYRNHEGQLHRIYGPAYINRLFKVEAWYKEGKLHRENGPAYIHKHNMAWFHEGKLHRLDGPAVITDAGPKQYWIYGVRYTQKQYKWEIRRMKNKGKIK